jgi:hypothetical protein
MQLPGVEARVEQDDLKVVTGSRVALAGGPDIPVDALEKSSHGQAGGSLRCVPGDGYGLGYPLATMTL